MEAKKVVIGNDAVAAELQKLDYTKLTGKAWDDYRDIVEGTLADPKKRLGKRVSKLDMNQLFDFVGYQAYPIIEDLYEGIPESPKVVTGIKLKDTTPKVECTRTTLRSVMDLNAQLYNGQCNHRVPMTYYLIKQVEVKEPKEAKETKSSRNEK